MLLTTEKLTKQYKNTGGHMALQNAEISVKPGETVGLFGESGSGKSTLGMMAAGLLSLPPEEFWQTEKKFPCHIKKKSGGKSRFCSSIRKLRLIRRWFSFGV